MNNLKVKDHSVSGEQFHLIENTKYGFLETQPQPALNDLANYYESEDYISHTNAKRNLFEKAYHLVRIISLKRKLKLINSSNIGDKSLLDIGCGTGDFLQIAKQNGWTVCGIEPNKKARSIANSKTEKAVFETDKLKELKPNSFDTITLWHVLEHLSNLEMQVKILKNLLKENGTLIIAVPNYKSYDAQVYQSNWAAYDVPRHLWHFSRASINKLFEEKQMKVIKTLPMLFDAYYVCLLSEKYKSGKMNVLKSFWTGFRSNIKAKRTKEYSSLIYVIKNA